MCVCDVAATVVHADSASVPTAQQSAGQGSRIYRRSQPVWICLRLPVRTTLSITAIAAATATDTSEHVRLKKKFLVVVSVR